MPRYTLIHLQSPNGGDEHLRAAQENARFTAILGGDPLEAVRLGLYAPACIVEAHDPEDLFARTQNIDAPWTELSPPLFGSDTQRSTSVGDLIIDADGRVLFCATVGWDDAPDALAAAARKIAWGFGSETHANPGVSQ